LRNFDWNGGLAGAIATLLQIARAISTKAAMIPRTGAARAVAGVAMNRE
jgi:hypothetical protein